MRLMLPIAPEHSVGRMAVVLVTGATDGVGRALAIQLAREGHEVLVHGRSEERIAQTLELVPGARAYRADLASLDQVRALAADVLEHEDRLDVLVNNAGIGNSVPGGGQRQESEDGHELRFAVNYLAGYLLARELLPLLERSAPARIVNVASAGQMPIDFDDVMLERDYDGVRAYCQSKLAQIMHAFDLSERLAAGVTMTALHPSTYMPTKILSASPASTIEEGMEAVRRLAVDPELEGVTGRYFNVQREAEANEQAYDAAARERLRDLSETLTS
jgi:NAD(P)-dependent dehydrogenase (short-subunit alcohol dehydrogenase family)